MQAARFYHGSRKLFDPGFQLAPQPDGYVHYSEVSEFERLVEARRPADKLSRLEAVYLSADPELIDGAGGYNDAVYLVEPLSPPEASDLAWYSEAWCEFDSEPHDAAAVVSLIDRYWAGEPYHDLERSNLEYRVSAALVVEMTELNVDLNELEVLALAPDQAPGF